VLKYLSMVLAKRTFGQPASLEDLMTSGKEFTDAAMSIDILEVLRAANYKRNIGHTAAHLSGVKLESEGDATSKRIVFVAYDTIHDLMHPTLLTHGADAARDLFKSETTHATLADLSGTIDSYALSQMAHQYRTQGNYLHVGENGLIVDEDCVIPKEFLAKRGGCPYAKNTDNPYFNKFTDHVVDTYAGAHQRNMPYGWLAAHSLRRHR
jgi:hypothetical protein